MSRDAPEYQIVELKEAIGRAIDATGHARFLAQTIDKQTARPEFKEMAVVLLGARKQLQGCETKLEDLM